MEVVLYPKRVTNFKKNLPRTKRMVNGKARARSPMSLGQKTNKLSRGRLASINREFIKFFGS